METCSTYPAFRVIQVIILLNDGVDELGQLIVKLVHWQCGYTGLPVGEAGHPGPRRKRLLCPSCDDTMVRTATGSFSACGNSGNSTSSSGPTTDICRFCLCRPCDTIICDGCLVGPLLSDDAMVTSNVDNPHVSTPNSDVEWQAVPHLDVCPVTPPRNHVASEPVEELGLESSRSAELHQSQQAGVGDSFRRRRITRPRICASCCSRKEADQWGLSCSRCSMFVCTIGCRRSIGSNCGCHAVSGNSSHVDGINRSLAVVPLQEWAAIRREDVPEMQFDQLL